MKKKQHATKTRRCVPRPAPLMTMHFRPDGSARVDRPGGLSVVLGRDAVDVLLAMRPRRAIDRADVERTLSRFASLGLTKNDALLPGEARGARRRPLPPRLFRWLVQKGASYKGCNALDIGCGGGRVAIELARAGARVTAIDASAAVVAALGREQTEEARIAVMQANALDLPIADASMDLVVLDQILPFVAPLAAFEEAARVTRSGGTLVVVMNRVLVGGRVVSPSTPIDPALVLRALGWRSPSVFRTHERIEREARTTTAVAARKP